MIKIYVDVNGGLLPLPLGHPEGSHLLPHVLQLLLQLLIPGPELCVFLNIMFRITILQYNCQNVLPERLTPF